jgi:hypothetical protein
MEIGAYAFRYRSMPSTGLFCHKRSDRGRSGQGPMGPSGPMDVIDELRNILIILSGGFPAAISTG